MLLLAVDTSGKAGSLALVQADPDGASAPIEVVLLDGGAFSAQLVPQIASLLSKNGFNKNDIGGFVVVSGPGSFTGLRVGLAAIKALAEVLRKPIAEVSMLAAVAASGDCQQNVSAALNAGRNEIYIGEFDSSSNGVRCSRESLVTREQFLDSIPRKNVVTTDAEIATQARAAGATVQLIDPLKADVIAKLGWKKLLSNEIISPEALEARYVGRPDSEMFSKK